MKEVLHYVTMRNVNTGNRITIYLWHMETPNKDSGETDHHWWISVESKKNGFDNYEYKDPSQGPHERRTKAIEEFYECVNLNLLQDGYRIEFLD